jgi:hypothetical protein
MFVYSCSTRGGCRACRTAIGSTRSTWSGSGTTTTSRPTTGTSHPPRHLLLCAVPYLRSAHACGACAYPSSYIQWLFPIFEGQGMNFGSYRLLKEEARKMRRTLECNVRFLRSYKYALITPCRVVSCRVRRVCVVCVSCVCRVCRVCVVCASCVSCVSCVAHSNRSVNATHTTG